MSFAPPASPRPRRPIRRLSPGLVNRIAAGEVIERPASVVKELVENALDAGATRITVETENGGKGLIRVTDDGCGIPPDELELSLAQHATSKIADDAELAAVASMGFRGEALASIASVSHLRLLSRTPDAVGGHELRCVGGEIEPIRDAPANAGTSVEVRHLFFNTPARRKFLKSDAAESGQITEMLTRLALPRSDVSFSHIRDGRTIFDWPATDAASRWLIGWPADLRPGAMTLDVVDRDWRIRGIVARPEFAATSSRYQYLYVNGRPVKDRTAQQALREAYRGLTEPGRHPAAILLIDVPPGEVDVNVHPTKAEVRFRESGRLFGAILSAVREALLGNDLSPVARPRQEMPQQFAQPRENVHESLAAFFKDALGQAQQHLGDLPREDAVGPERVDSVSTGAPRPEAHATSAQDDVPPASDNAQGFKPWGDSTNTILPARSAIQLHNSYLVVQSDDGMEIIDQHALHERVIYEDLLARVRRGPLESQRMLLPATFSATDAQLAALEDLADVFAQLGIEAVAFGPGTGAVQAFPSFLSKLDPAAFVRDLLDRAAEDIERMNDEELLHEVLDMMSCKAAVKAGDPLSPAEIDALVARRGLTSRSSNCPHGRPTTLKLSLADLEKQFKRTGF